MGKTYRIRIFVALILLCIGVIHALTVRVSAATSAVNSDITEFANMEGSAQYINNSDGYYLDVNTEEIDIFWWCFQAINGIANILFILVKWIGKLAVVLFYQCMNFDIAELFKDQISAIQRTLNNGIFEPMFILGFCGSAVIILKNIIRRDMMGAYGQILKVIGIVILSILLVRDSSKVLSKATMITKEACTQALVGIQGDEVVGVSSFAAQSAAVLWDNLVHEPWVFIEFGGDSVSEDEIYSFLSLDPDSDERKSKVVDYAGSAFRPSRTFEKVGFTFLYLVPFIIKCAVYIVMALLSLLFQVIAIFYVLLAPVVLLLTMVPGYEGLISAWLRKMLESQLSILIMSFLIGLLVKFDSMLYEVCAGSWGWLVVLVVQAIIDVLIVYKRNELLGALSNLQKRVSPKYARTMMIRGADAFQLADRGIQTGAKAARIGMDSMDKVGRGINNEKPETGKKKPRTQNSAVERPITVPEGSNIINLEEYKSKRNKTQEIDTGNANDEGENVSVVRPVMSEAKQNEKKKRVSSASKETQEQKIPQRTPNISAQYDTSTENGVNVERPVLSENVSVSDLKYRNVGTQEWPGEAESHEEDKIVSSVSNESQEQKISYHNPAREIKRNNNISVQYSASTESGVNVERPVMPEAVTDLKYRNVGTQEWSREAEQQEENKIDSSVSNETQEQKILHHNPAREIKRNNNVPVQYSASTESGVNVKRPSMEEKVENLKPTQETKKTSAKNNHTSRTVKKVQLSTQQHHPKETARQRFESESKAKVPVQRPGSSVIEE